MSLDPVSIVRQFPPTARAVAENLEASKIREVANAGFGDPDILPFWFGESDQPTPDFIVAAAQEALGQRKTFYSHNLGILELRETLADYLRALHGWPIEVQRLAITSAGVSALMLAAQAVIDPGDRVVVVTPVWPNVAEIPKIMGAEVVRVGLSVQGGRWSLDLDRLLAALTPTTRALFLNSPNNPTGWTLPEEALAPILEHCRKHGIWLISDDVYERLSFATPKAPSFLPLTYWEDRYISTNSFSKAWRMTGFRLGWMVIPPELLGPLGVLLEYNTSCAPEFIQRAAIAALRDGEPTVTMVREQLASARDMVTGALAAMPGIEIAPADGAMYAFFRLDGCTDSLGLAKTLVREAKLGLAPGVAFGPEAEGWLRWCLAAAPEKAAQGLERLERYLAAR